MATMKVRVSTPMARAIAQAMQEKGMQFEECKVRKFSERGYVLQVAGTDGMFEAHDNGDYDYAKDEYKAIQIVWPYDCHACPTYITTKDLVRWHKESRATDVNGLMDYICDSIAV